MSRGFRRRDVVLASSAAILTATPSMALSPPSYMVFFEYGKTEIDDRGERTIFLFVEAVRRLDSYNISLLGNCDTSEASVALSEARAIAVKMRLLELGVPPASITVRSCGDSRLLVITPPRTREPQNRRVELIVQLGAGG
jgi:OOP family OmpA-OmpF porin